MTVVRRNPERISSFLFFFAFYKFFFPADLISAADEEILNPTELEEKKFVGYFCLGQRAAPRESRPAFFLFYELISTGNHRSSRVHVFFFLLCLAANPEFRRRRSTSLVRPSGLCSHSGVYKRKPSVIPFLWKIISLSQRCRKSETFSCLPHNIQRYDVF